MQPILSMSPFRAGRSWLAAALALAAVASAATVQAAPYQFANFNNTISDQPFTWTNNGSSGTISLNHAITFNFTTATGLSTADHQATITITGAPNFTPATSAAGFDIQPISSVQTLKITENGTGANLLTLLFTGNIAGPDGSPTANITGSDTKGNVVVYTSDFGSFIQPGNSYNIALNPITPNLSIDGGGFLTSFVAGIAGVFTANFVTLGVPAPASIAMLGTGALAPIGLLLGRRKRAPKPATV